MTRSPEQIWEDVLIMLADDLPPPVIESILKYATLSLNGVPTLIFPAEYLPNLFSHPAREKVRQALADEIGEEIPRLELRVDESLAPAEADDTTTPGTSPAPRRETRGQPHRSTHLILTPVTEEKLWGYMMRHYEALFEVAYVPRNERKYIAHMIKARSKDDPDAGGLGIRPTTVLIAWALYLRDTDEAKTRWKTIRNFYNTSNEFLRTARYKGPPADMLKDGPKYCCERRGKCAAEMATTIFAREKTEPPEYLREACWMEYDGVRCNARLVRYDKWVHLPTTTDAPPIGDKEEIEIGDLDDVEFF